MAKKAVYVFFMIMVCVSCKENMAPEISIPDSVTIIFQDAPGQSSTSRFGSNLSSLPEGTLEFVDTTLHRIYYTPRNIGMDTLSVPACNGYAEIVHSNQVIESISYLLIAGDTILFTYGSDSRPQIRSLTSDRNTWLYNLPFDDERAVQPVGYSTQTVMSHRMYGRADMLVNRPKQKYSDELTTKVKSYYIDLDSLRPIYADYITDFAVRLDSLELSGSIPSVYADFYRRQAICETPKTGEEMLPLIGDSMMQYVSGYRMAVRYAYATGENDRSTAIFDRVAADTLISGLARNAMLHDLMAQIESGEFGWRTYPQQTVQGYRDRYREITGDTTFVIRHINKDNLVYEDYSADLLLQGLDGEQYDYKDILSSHKGKVIYVDMWASWCAPCIAGMPAARKLREANKDNDVVFLYLAMNDTRDAWRGAVRKHETGYLGDNYLVLNAADSEFLKQIKHRSIPRFLLYDRQGKLADMDAPRPDDENIQKKINELLRDNS